MENSFDNTSDSNGITTDDEPASSGAADDSATFPDSPDSDNIISDSIPGSYDDSSIQHLDWNEHIRRRPGMYIGKLGDGSHAEDGIYVLIKEVVDNSIDEFNMGAGKEST